MNYGEIKQNLISLGFAEETDYEEFEELGYTFDAINRAITQIANHFPYVKKYETELDGTEDEILYFDFTSIDSSFLSFADTPILFEMEGKDYYVPFTDYEIETDTTIVISGNNSGSYRFYYNALPTQIVSTTPDTFVTEIPLKCHHLIPLLASYYLWLDDDAPKATQYYNMYETELSMVLQKQNKPRARVEVNKEWGAI